MNNLISRSVLGLTLALTGCVSDPKKGIFDASQSQVQLRSYQSRVFDTADFDRTMRAVIATFQDLGFVIDKADHSLGTVSGTKLSKYQIRISVMVRPQGEKQMLVRANAEFTPFPQSGAPGKAIEEPGPYQDFFAALEKSRFLEAQPLN